MPVRPKAKQDEVEDGKPCGLLHRELLDQLSLVSVGEFVNVVEEGGVDVVNVFGRDVDFGEENLLAECVVGVFVVERDSSLIGVENMPTDPLTVQL